MQMMKWSIPTRDTYFEKVLEQAQGTYQKQHRQNSLKYVTNFDTAIDVGAHIGTWTIELEEVFNKVICFEPIQAHIDCLLKNIQNPDKVTLYPHALGDKEGSAVVDYATEGNSGTAGVITEDEELTLDSSTVIMHTLDYYEFPTIDYLKVDIEGYELPFLKGAKETIIRTKPIMNIEIKDTCKRFGTEPEDIVKYITDELGMTFVERTVADAVFKYN
jgi:FkbM family methyltransferase